MSRQKCMSFSKRSNLGALLTVNMFPEPMDGFSEFKRCLEAEKILKILHRTDYKIFVSANFIFSLNFSIIDFQEHKTTLKASLSKYSVLEIIV